MHECKLKAGSIIAAIATTTAAATALVMVEMYKILGNKDVSNGRKSDFGLASNFYQFIGTDDLWPTKAGKDVQGNDYVTFPGACALHARRSACIRGGRRCCPNRR